MLSEGGKNVQKKKKKKKRRRLPAGFHCGSETDFRIECVTTVTYVPATSHLYRGENKPNLTPAVWQTQYLAVAPIYGTGALTGRDDSCNKVAIYFIIFLSRLPKEWRAYKINRHVPTRSFFCDTGSGRPAPTPRYAATNNEPIIEK